jgi:Bacterial Ig-like domain (group 1)./IPT/TIG domain./Peptidase M30.
MGAGQSGVVGTELQTPIGIKVTGASGKTLAGVTVNFAVRANSGSVNASSWKTNASGIASVTWTLGEKAGANMDTLEASVSGLSQKVIVTASVTAGAPASLAVISGDAQVGSPGEQAAEPLVVEVRDAHGNAKQGIVVSWAIEGGGTLSAAKDTSGADGRASVIWTLGAGDNRVTASIAGLTNVTAPFVASLTASDVVQLADVSPDTLVEGGSATLTGAGFSATIAGNKVYVDGVQAVVTSATATTLDITVPAFDCKPTRDAPVRVVVGTEGSNAVERSVKGKGTAVSLALGEQLIVRDPANFCLQIDESAVPASYLVGAQSVSELASSLTPVTVSATAAASGTLLALPGSSAPLTSRLATSGAALASVLATPEDQRWRLHRAAEARLRERERQLMAGRVTARSSAPRSAERISALQVSGTVQVGDTIPIKFPDISTNFCSTSIPITTVVRAVGTKGIWLEDVTNPTSGYTSDDFQNLSDEFDNDIYASDVAYFGEPTDFDSNGRVVIVTTKEVNKTKNVLGFVVSTDLESTSTCAASNDGEFYYGRAPDPDGLYEAPAPYTLTSARRDAQLLIAHEFTHVIQFGRRITYPGAQLFQSVWEMEGQATLAQEVVGNDINGRTSGQNYGATVALSADASGVSWYSPGFTDLALYYGFQSKTVHVATAPEQCSWLDLASNGNDGPCISGREVYGVPWLFLRWLSDQFGGSVAGGEAGVQKALIDNTRAGYENVENVVGVKIDTLLAQWAATLYTDDLWYPLNPNSRLTYTSWNLQDVYSRYEATARLTPNAHSFQSFSDAVGVRGGSTAYFTISGSSVPATAIKLRDASGQAIAAGGPMQLWIVRLQ